MIDQLHNLYYNQALQDIRGFKLEEGKRKLIKAITIDNNQTETWNLLGLVYYELGKLKSAQYCWKVSMEIDRMDNKAMCYLEDYEREILVIEPCLLKLKDLVKLRAFNKAKKVIREIPEQIANKVDILNFFGLIMFLGSDVDRARAYWIKSLNIAIDTMAPVYLANSIKMQNKSKFILNKIFKRNLVI